MASIASPNAALPSVASHSSSTTSPIATLSTTPRPTIKPKKPPLTHFLALPLSHTPSLESSLESFAQDLSTTFPTLPLAPAALVPAAAIHLTVAAMSLPTPESLTHALSILSSLPLPQLLCEAGQFVGVEDSKDLSPLKLTLRGLATMGSARKATVLYITPHDESGRLQGFSERVREGMKEVVVEEKRGLKLHATVANTKYVKKEGLGKRQPPVKLDLREVVEWGKDRVFGEEVEILGVGVYKMGRVGDEYIRVGWRGMEEDTEKVRDQHDDV